MSPVHPEIAAFLATLPPSDGSPVDAAVWRAMGEAHLPPLDERPPVAAVQNRIAATAAGEVPVRVYTPLAEAPSAEAPSGGARSADTSSDGGPTGLLVYFHGGAFFSGSLETHDAFARELAAASGYRVVSVGYRLAPEAAFPAGLEDCYAVLRWAVEHGDELGWDGERLAVAGDSSGGNFVASIAARAHDEGFDAITHQLLFYPSVDLDFDLDRYASLRENGAGYGLETVALRPHNAFYLESGADPADPRVSPIKRADLAGLPAALVVTAEYDPLRDEGEAYARRLEEAGVETTLIRIPGVTHGFMQHFAHLPESARAFREAGAFLTRG